MSPSSVLSGSQGMGHAHSFHERRVTSRQVSGMLESRLLRANGGPRRDMSKQLLRQASMTMDTSTITSVVYSLKRRSDNELGHDVSARLMGETHDSILDWIGAQRMSHLPPEGSSYDKVLAWTQLFVERLHSFEIAIEDFAADSGVAAHLAYGYCAILLELGQENAPALMTSLGFFYSISMSLVNLLERTEMFGVSQVIREQLVLALADLVTLVASVATHFHKAISGDSDESISINIYSNFSGQIRAFEERCEKIAESMWRHQLLVDNLDAEAVSDVKSIKQWLTPEDRALAKTAAGSSLLAHDREELTCLWVGSNLARFLKGQEKILSISGKPGSGKTIVSSVIVDYLQRPISGVRYNALFIPINSRVSAETSSRAIAKAILSQLFSKRIGNIQLLQILVDAFERSQQAISSEEYDNIVWEALERALSAVLPGARELVIVVDGIDESSLEEEKLFRRLANATEHGINVRLITLGKTKHTAQGQKNLQVGQELIFDDIMAVIRSQWESDNEFTEMSEFEQESIVTRLTEASAGSFLWAKLAARRLRREIGVDKFKAAIDNVIKTKPTITDFVQRNIKSSSVTDDARLMLMWLAVAERPLSLRELATLASIQVEKNTVSDKAIDVLTVMKHVQGLVFLQDGLMYIRHGLIRTSLHELIAKGELVPAVVDAHADLTTRLLWYIKTALTHQSAPSIKPLEDDDKSQLLKKHPLLEFALRYWPVHLTRSAVYTSGGHKGAAKAFAKLYPHTVTSMLLQASLWEQYPKPLLLTYLTTITNIYRECFTTASPLTLQCIIYLATIHSQIELINESAAFFFEAASLSSKQDPANHTLTLELANKYLELTESKVTNSKTEVMIRRETMFSVLVECYKAKYGQTSTYVVTALRHLVEHYRYIKEEKKCQTIMEYVHSITGSKSQSGTLETDNELQISLSKRKKSATTTEGVALHLGTQERDELIEELEYSIQRAEKCVVEGRIEVAERLYIEAWQHVSHEYRIHRSEVWADRNLSAQLSYSKFLLSQKRSSEASSILVSVWEEYRQSTGLLTESSVLMLVQVAHSLKSMSHASVSLTIFKFCLQYFQATNRVNTSAYKEIEQAIRITSQEIAKSASSSLADISETTLMEMIYERTSSITTVDQSTFASIDNLVSLFASQNRWHDASQFIEKVLQGIWPSLFSPNVQDVALVQEHVDSCVGLAVRLAECYHSQRCRDKEENIRVRVYRALRSGRKVDDKLRESAVSQLLSLYSQTSQKDSAITIRQEMLDDLTECHGEQHASVIKALWELAEFTRPWPIFVEYYQRIIRNLNKDTEVSKSAALKPIVIVSAELWNKGALSEALPYYRTLINTFVAAPKLSPLFQDASLVRESFDRYMACLRHSRTTFTAVYKIASEYQVQCKTVFGTSASITIHATLTLAEVCQDSKSTEAQVITLYEELLTLKSDEINRKDISAALEILYEKQTAMVMSKSSTTVSSSQVDRAVKVLHKRVTTVRETHGWAHEESLHQLTELVRFHSKQGETEVVSRELKEATVKILSTKTTSTQLITAASTIASSYVACNQLSQVTELTESLYRQIMVKDTTSVKTCQFDLTAKGRESLVFVAQLEYSLRRGSSTLTEIMATLTTQYAYFDEFRAMTRSKSSKFLDVSVATARLHAYLIKCARDTVASQVFDQYFHWVSDAKSKYVKQANLSTIQTKIFLHAVLDHLSTHKSKDVVRTVGIIGSTKVPKLLDEKRYQDACDLAIACFKFIAAKPEAYRTPIMVKLVLTSGMSLGSRVSNKGVNNAARAALLRTSEIIVSDVLRVMTEMNINLAKLELVHLNQLVILLGAQENHETLASLLTMLWNSREAQRDWDPAVTFTLARRYILARYVVGDTIAALRIAEHIVYNCRRVHGLYHPSTLEMSTLLSQLYSGLAQRHHQQATAATNGQKSGSTGAKEMANRYYKKSATLHENILRGFSDPDFASMDGGSLMDRMDGASSVEGGSITPLHAIRGTSPVRGHVESEGQCVRRHLRLLKLALQRLGSWPKDYAEYERLNADVFAQYTDDLKGVEGVEKWDLKAFGDGKAEADIDLLRPEDLQNWELIDERQSTNGHTQEEEEL
ncbi:hypothetical protein JX266_001434 [Neoarthrinium moseri]|nr:hypothetical protein JX266_001434 [Neoarthrinium moseri]